MKKMMYACLCLLLMMGLLAGCNDDAQGGEGAGETNRLAEIVELTDNETAALQAGETTDIEITPELKLCFWEAANMDMWFHLPEFVEGEQPTDLADYWYLVLTDNVTGLDEGGWLLRDDRWEEVPDGSEYGWPGCAMIPVGDVQSFVRRHFGDVELRIADHSHKMYDFDGEYLYQYMDGSLPQGLFALQALTAEKYEDGRVVYEAKLVSYEPGELDGYQLITDAVINGKTDGFGVDEELTVRFYIDEETCDTVYLAVAWE